MSNQIASNRIARIGGLLISSLGLAVAGCNESPPSTAISAPPMQSKLQAQNSSAIAQLQPGDPNADAEKANTLAQQTTLYAQQMTPLLQTRPLAATQPGASVVQWAQPSDNAKGPQDDAKTSPAKNSQGFPFPGFAPKQPEAIQANAKLKIDSDLPQVLPESADDTPTPKTPAPAAPDHAPVRASTTFPPPPTTVVAAPTPAVTSAAAPSLTQPVTASTDVYEQKLVDQIHQYPKDVSAQLDYELLRLVRQEPAPDMTMLSSLSSEDREVISSVLDGLNNFRNTTRADDNMMLGQKIQPLLDMADRLRSQAELAIPTIALCTSVKSFGVYTPLNSPRMIAGRDHEVVVYCEVQNFTSAQTADKTWETKLTQELELFTESGLAVWPEKAGAQPLSDSSHNRRHDFFISRLVTLPASLPVGNYILKVTISDEQSHRVAQTSTPVQLVSQ